MIKAWAVTLDGNVLPNTVAATRRAALVNYLVAERGIAVFHRHSDEDINRMWDTYHADAAHVCEVDVGTHVQYVIGPNLKEHFAKHGIENLSDLQLVLNTIDEALASKKAGAD